ncbi:MAG: helix-turn-helix domain-containing protein [Solirubrobacterales bacterium]|nr:helix-turn-helix domain-containing protein [Solirubrobacterales bacterium]
MRAGLHRTEIGLLERGERVPRIDTLIKLAAAVSVPPSQLLEGIHWQPATTSKGKFTVSAPSQPGTANRRTPHTSSLRPAEVQPRTPDTL